MPASLRNRIATAMVDDPETGRFRARSLLFDGMTIMSGGIGFSGNHENPIPTERATGADCFGVWMLLDSRQVRKMVSSYVGENKLLECASSVSVSVMDGMAKTGARLAFAEGVV